MYNEKELREETKASDTKWLFKKLTKMDTTSATADVGYTSVEKKVWDFKSKLEDA